MAPAIRVVPTAANRALKLLQAVQFNHPATCPCHSSPSQHHHHSSPTLFNHAKRSLATPVDASRQKEYAFEMAASSIRFGPGCTKEVGMDLKNLGAASRVCVVTDAIVGKLDAMKQVSEALSRESIDFTVFDRTRIEPKDTS